jgi:tetratricopeptide (TPR) repeat protein
MGVRAVVAAGWAVDDQAGMEFARRFYAEMLAGQEFGQAVLVARQEIYARFGAANTWGAYQCYGDPGFALKAVDDTRGNGEFVAELEVLIEVERLTRNLRGANKDQCSALERRLERLTAQAPASWLKSGRLCAAIASFYGELKQFEKAVDYFERVLIAHPATASLKDVEQLANQLARLAADQQPPSVKQLERSAGMLKQLYGLGKTSERLSLRGSTAKRYAQAASGKKRLDALREMTAAYLEGYENAAKNQASNPWYPLQNVVAGKVAISWQRDVPKKLSAGIAEDLERLRDLASNIPERTTDFWETCLPIDIALLEAAVSGVLSPALKKKIAANYSEAFKRGTARETDSAIKQIVFLQAMASSSSRKAVRQLAEALTELVESLRREANGDSAS